MDEKKPIYFKGLTELRAIAAIAVIFYHIESYKNRQGEISLFKVKYIHVFIEGLGPNGVYLFFVLSGFLITYLLLQEKAVTGTIAIRKFYTRRILRIWPLYYIIVAISFILIPLTLGKPFWINETYYQELISHLQFGKNLILFLCFLSNLALIIFAPVVGASQSWSVSIEEQFYFFWPILMKVFNKHILTFLLIIAVLKPIIVAGLYFEVKLFSPEIKVLILFLNEMKIEYMAIGGLLAYIFINKSAFSKRIFSSKKLFIANGVLLIVFLLINKSFYVNALLFALLIGFIIHANFENRFLKKIGEVSYGMYMYHPLMLYLSFSIVHNFFRNANGPGALCSEYLLVMLLTYLASFLSYRYIELFFLGLKSKYTVVSNKA